MLPMFMVDGNEGVAKVVYVGIAALVIGRV
jgi:hypothetical protein